MTEKLSKKKYQYPENLEDWMNWLNDADDGALRKYYQYLSRAKNEFEEKVILKLTDEMVTRNLL